VAVRETRDSLHRFGLARDRLAAALRQASGLTPSELATLEHLEIAGPLTQRELAERLSLTSGGTTLLVDRLEKRGLVARRPHPADRRAVLVELRTMPAGRAASAVERYEAAVTAAARRLSVAEREAVIGFLDSAASAAVEAVATLRDEVAAAR